MAHSMHGCEVHAVVAFDEASDLTINDPCSPWGSDGPVDLLDPSSGSVCRHSTIGVSRVEKDFYFISEDVVDPLGAFSLVMVEVLSHALRPGLGGGRDVEGSSNISSVHIVADVGSKEGDSKGMLHVLGPRSIVFHRKSSLILLHLAIDDYLAFSSGILKQEATVWVYLSEQVVPVESTGKVVDLVPGVVAELRVIEDLDIVEVVMAVWIVHDVQQVLGNDVEVEDNVGERWGDVQVPVGSSISNDVTLEGNDALRVRELFLEVELINLPWEVGHIDAGIALTRDVEIVLHKVGEFGVEALEGVQEVNWLEHVVCLEVGIGICGRVSDSGGTLDIKHVMEVVPGVGIRLNDILAVINNERAIFLEESEHGWAARATIEPDEYWISRGVVQGLNVDVMEVFVLGGIDVPTVPVGGKHATVGELSDSVMSRLGDNGCRKTYERYESDLVHVYIVNNNLI
jgi:hypothetical protein